MYRGNATTINAIAATMDGRLRQLIRLTPTERAGLVAFLKALTDPAARDLSGSVPASVPSGLPIREETVTATASHGRHGLTLSG